MTTKQRGRPRLNLTNKPRLFRQIERTPQFDADLLTVRQHLAATGHGVTSKDITISFIVRYAVRLLAERYNDD
jgi:hypothetical protein